MKVEKTRRRRSGRRRAHLGPRHAHDLPRAAVVRAGHDGLAGEDESRPRRRDRADGDPRNSERRARPTHRLALDDVARRLRASPDPRLDPASACGRDAQLPAPARARRPARLLHAAVLRVATDDPARARRRGRAADVAGKQPDRRRRRVLRADRTGSRRPLDPRHRRAERPLRGCGDLLRRVPPRPRLRSAAQADRRRGAPEGPRRGAIPARRQAARAPLPRWSSRSGSSCRACRLGCPSTPSRPSTGARASRASSTPLSAPALSSGASLPCWPCAGWRRSASPGSRCSRSSCRCGCCRSCLRGPWSSSRSSWRCSARR